MMAVELQIHGHFFFDLVKTLLFDKKLLNFAGRS